MCDSDFFWSPSFSSLSLSLSLSLSFSLSFSLSLYLLLLASASSSSLAPLSLLRSPHSDLTNPYCVLKLEDQQFRTRTMFTSPKPSWYEDFQLYVLLSHSHT